MNHRPEPGLGDPDADLGAADPGRDELGTHEPDSASFEQRTSESSDLAAGGPDDIAEPSAGKKKWKVAAVGTGLAVVLFALTAAWWQHEPETPLEQLGLESLGLSKEDGAQNSANEPSEAKAELDAEQLAFLERQRQRAQELEANEDLAEGLEAEGGVTLTDRSLIRSLAGRWRLDLGGRQIVAEFAPVVVDRVRRGSLLVELYPVDSRYLPPFYTVFELPDKGTYIAFRAADGSYRLVLEDVRFHGPELFSFQLGRSGQRRTAYRLKGSVPPSLEETRPEDPSGESAADAGRGDPPVRIVVEPSPPAAQLWAEAEGLRDAGRLHSLKGQLQRLLNAYPRHRQARRWSRRVDGWIQDQREDLIDNLRDELEHLRDGVRDHDLEEIFESWQDRPDAKTRQFFTELLGRHRYLEARFGLQSVKVEDGTATFSATATLEGWSGRSRNREIIPLRWRGQFRDGHFVSPFG